MIAVDTNVLVFAHRADSAFHRQACDFGRFPELRVSNPLVAH